MLTILIDGYPTINHGIISYKSSIGALPGETLMAWQMCHKSKTSMSWLHGAVYHDMVQGFWKNICQPWKMLTDPHFGIQTFEMDYES